MTPQEWQAFKSSQKSSYLGEDIYKQAINYLNSTAKNIAPAVNDIKSAVNSFIGNQQQQAQGQIVSPLPAIKNAVSQITPTATPTPTMKQYDFSGFTTTPVPEKVAPIIYKAAINNKIDPNAFASLLFSEHGFITDKNKTPSYDESGNFLGFDRGVAQLNSLFHPEISDEQAFDPEFAINYAAKLLAGHLKQFNGDYNRAIASYNVGPGGASIQGPMPYGGGPKGQAYLDKIARGLSSDLVKKLNLKPSFKTN